MKKLIISLIMFLSFVTFANAKECVNGLPSPPIYYNGNWAFGQTIKLKTTASSCLATNTSVYFEQFGDYLPGFGFYAEAMLMEDDEHPNEDDPVKLYYGHSSGTSGWSWSKPEILDYGNLDSAGDQTCELYVKFRVHPKLASNNVEYFKQGLIRYTICMD